MTIGIVGYGSFGAFLEQLAEHYLPEVKLHIASIGRAPDGKRFFAFEEVCKSDILILAVPICAFAEVLTEAEKHMRPDTVVIDVATVKKHTVEALRKITSRPFVAMHPMFGPESYKKTRSLEGLRVVLSDHTVPEELYQRLKEKLAEVGLAVIEMDADTHDKLLANTLFVSHLVGQTVARAGFARTPVDTVSFGFLMDAVESVAHDNELFQDVWRYNPYCKDTLSQFEEGATEVRKTLE